MATLAPALRLSLAALRRPVFRFSSSQARCFTSLHQRQQQQQPPRLSPLSSNLPNNTCPHHHSSYRAVHTSPPSSSSSSSSSKPPNPSSSDDNNPPASNQQLPPTNFSDLDVLGTVPVPSTAVEACHADGFVLNSGVRITGGDGVLLVNGEAFVWRPWRSAGGGDGGVKGGVGKGRRLVNGKGQWEVGEEAFAVLGMVLPRPDLLILGLGPEILPLSPATRRAITNLGMRVEVLDTRNAASQYNMLATERGVDDVAAALIPIRWKDEA
ncbi:hypothetical protein C8A05DRAFT_11757 [Staphylotrichum tortipilum]|uniref:NADH dehydrogenase [ubiquinone] 1 alpha subcomplex assembly factor 3 n=1 Tax=Staphylotrichum tortipilum TaxID=2831512 RepID=A0AAN6MU35_9PEZI|nr:hypothetical protein C8A05DRAFT_11757 [Staphylotrichum longicolle]